MVALNDEESNPQSQLVRITIGFVFGMLANCFAIGVDYCLKLTDVQVLELLMTYGFITSSGFALLILFQVIYSDNVNS